MKYKILLALSIMVGFASYLSIEQQNNKPTDNTYQLDRPCGPLCWRKDI